MYLYYINVVDSYMNAIEDMQNENDVFYLCNVFEYNHDFVKVFRKSDDALLVFIILDNNVSLYEIDYYKVLLLVYIFHQI